MSDNNGATASTYRFTQGPYLLAGTLIYSLEPCGRRKGVEQFENRFGAHLEAGRNCPREEAQATARLLAASWDLLKALVQAERALSAVYQQSPSAALTTQIIDAGCAANAAIQKARGER